MPIYHRPDMERDVLIVIFYNPGCNKLKDKSVFVPPCIEEEEEEEEESLNPWEKLHAMLNQAGHADTVYWKQSFSLVKLLKSLSHHTAE